MQDNMGIADNFRGGEGRQTIMATEMQDNGVISDRDTGRCIWRQ